MALAALDRDALIEDAIAERLKTHALLIQGADIVPYPDDLSSLGMAQKRSIILVRVYQEKTQRETVQGARVDIARELCTVSLELRFLTFQRTGEGGVGQHRGFCKDALANFKPVINHPKYTVIRNVQHISGGLIGRVQGSKRWDYYDAYEMQLIYESRDGGYPANA